MANAGQGDKVRVHYTGTLADGSVFDSSEGREPLEFTIGQGQMIPGFEQGVIGMEPGQSKTITIPSDQAYGSHEPDKVIQMDRSQMPPDMPMENGSTVQGTQEGGGSVTFTIVDVTETQVTLDGNHPLAGKDLTFALQLVDIA